MADFPDCETCTAYEPDFLSILSFSGTPIQTSIHPLGSLEIPHRFFATSRIKYKEKKSNLITQYISLVLVIPLLQTTDLHILTTEAAATQIYTRAQLKIEIPGVLESLFVHVYNKITRQISASLVVITPRSLHHDCLTDCLTDVNFRHASQYLLQSFKETLL